MSLEEGLLQMSGEEKGEKEGRIKSPKLFRFDGPYYFIYLDNSYSCLWYLFRNELVFYSPGLRRRA